MNYTQQLYLINTIGPLYSRTQAKLNHFTCHRNDTRLPGNLNPPTVAHKYDPRPLWSITDRQHCPIVTYTVSPGEQIFRATAQHYSIYSISWGIGLLRNRATTLSPQGLGSPPNRVSGNSLLDYDSLPWSIMDRLLLRKGGYPQLLRKRLTLLPGLVRRPRHLPLGCQPRSPECSTHDSLSIYRNAELFWTRHTSLPDSTAQRKRHAGQPHFSSIYPPQITQTSYKRFLSQSYTFEAHNNSLLLHTAIILTITSIPGLYCKIGTL